MRSSPTNQLFQSALLLEDDPSHAVLIRRALQELVGSVETATTVAAARSLLEERRFDVVITDLRLPDSDDISHVARLVDQAQQAPVVVLTSSNSIAAAVDALKMGASDFLVKQFGDEFPSVLRITLTRLQDLLAQRQERARLEAQMRALMFTTDQSADGVAIISPSMELSYRNRSFEQYVELWNGRYEPQAFIGDGRGEDVIVDAMGARKKVADFFAQQTQGVLSFEVGLSPKRCRAWGVTITRLGSDVPSVIRVQDISELKRKEKLQRDVISTTSHDLKGPLATIMLSAEMLGEMPLDATAAKVVRQMASSAKSSLQMIEEYLSARSIKEGVLVLTPVATVMSRVLRDIVDEYLVTATARSVQLVLMGETSSEATYSVDPVALRRIVGNLVSNALKFTPKQGTVTVRYTARPEEAVIEVQDTGVGIAPPDLARLFEEFSRVGNANSVEGSGLGLFVVKSLVSAHGGNVTVQSNPGMGTTFSVVLPRTPETSADGTIRTLSFA